MEKNNLILEPRRKHDYTPDANILYDMIVIGGGVSGFSAGMYANRLGMKVLLIADSFGGTIMLTNNVENWPGFISISGQKLAKLIENHAKDYDINILKELVLDVNKKNNYFEVSTKEENFKGKTILFATGTKLRRLGVSGEGAFIGKGVSYCALCDAMFFKDKIVGVVGGGDSAVKEALFLTEHAKKVYIICRNENIHAEAITLKRMQEKIKEKKIELINNTNVIEIKGEQLLSHVVLDKEYNGKKELELNGLFIEIGRIPLSDLAVKLGVEVNEKNEIKTDRLSRTNIKGIYGAGDVTDFPMKQAFTGASAGIIASYSAYEYLEKLE